MIKARADENQSSVLKICVAVNKEKGSGTLLPEPFLVGMTGFEPATSCSQRLWNSLFILLSHYF